MYTFHGEFCDLRFSEILIQSQEIIETMVTRKLNISDIVRVKAEWLDSGEDGTMCYVVLETMGENRVFVQALGTGASSCSDIHL